MTAAELRKLGYRLTHGAYFGTADDRGDRWYIEDVNSDTIDRRGPGYRTRAEAMDAARELERALFPVLDLDGEDCP